MRIKEIGKSAGKCWVSREKMILSTFFNDLIGAALLLFYRIFKVNNLDEAVYQIV